MKAVVFTTDAIFALIIASVAITILLYFSYTPPTPALVSYSKTQSILNTMLSVQLGAIANGSQIVQQVVVQGNAAGSTWMQYKGNASRGAGLPYGPLVPAMEYDFNSWGQISPAPLAAYGNVYFAAGGTLGAINASSGAFLWNTSIGGAPSSMALYNNLFIYSNTVAIAAVSTGTGSGVWTAATSSASPSTPILIYNNYAIFGTTSNTINAYYASNGVLAWSSSPGFEALSLAVVNGSIAAGSSSGGLGLMTGTGGLLSYAVPSNTVTTDIVGLNNVIAYGNNKYACAFSTSNTNLFCQSISGNTILGVAVAQGNLIYQSGNSISELTTSGNTVWSSTISNSYGSGMDYPVVSGKLAYTEWSGTSVTPSTLIASNLSTGRRVWVTSVPYGLGNTILAYGRLYTAAGTSIMAFGGCDANPQSSIMEAVVSLYVDGDGSCASALANSVYPMSNSSIFMNSSFLPDSRIAAFNGIGRITATSSNILSNYSRGITYVAWFNTSNPSGLQGVVSQGISSGIHSALYLTGNQLECDVVTSAGIIGTTNTIIPTQLKANSIYQGGLAFNATSEVLGCYLNGALGVSVAENTGSYVSNNALIIGSYGGNFVGTISNVQVYDLPLTGSEMTSLWQEGMQAGPIYGNSLVAWYPLDGDANDYSGYNNTGYPTNVFYKYTGYAPASLKNAFELTKSSAVLPVSSYVAQFNGTNGYINVGSNPSLSPTNAQTLSAWFYYEGSVSSGEEIVGLTGSHNLLGTYSSGTAIYPSMYWTTSGTTGGYDLIANYAPLTPNTWYFIAETYSSTTGDGILYLNGAIAPVTNTHYFGGTISVPNSYPITIGARGGGSSLNFNGLIADVQDYNTTLSAAQIKVLYAEGMEGAPLPGAGIVGWWPLNGNANEYAGGNNGRVNKINYTWVSSLYNTGVYSWK